PHLTSLHSCGTLNHVHQLSSRFSFFTDNPHTELSTLSLHDALPISPSIRFCSAAVLAMYRDAINGLPASGAPRTAERSGAPEARSEEHTSELQSRSDLVCRLLLEKKKKE